MEEYRRRILFSITWKDNFESLVSSKRKLGGRWLPILIWGKNVPSTLTLFKSQYTLTMPHFFINGKGAQSIAAQDVIGNHFESINLKFKAKYCVLKIFRAKICLVINKVYSHSYSKIYPKY